MEEQEKSTGEATAEQKESAISAPAEGQEQSGSPVGVEQQTASGQTTPTEAGAGQQVSGEQMYSQDTPAQNQTQMPNSQPTQPEQSYQLPPGYTIDPVTGQVVFVGSPVAGQPVQPGYVQPQVVYMQAPQPTPEQVAAQQAAAQQRYGQVVGTVEKFIEGEATVADVVKTLYTNTSADDQLWKGVIVGAAAAVLLTSEPVREVMGKTLGRVFPGFKKKSASAAGASHSTNETAAKPEPDKEK